MTHRHPRYAYSHPQLLACVAVLWAAMGLYMRVIDAQPVHLRECRRVPEVLD